MNKYLDYEKCAKMTKDGYIPEEGNRYVIKNNFDDPFKSDYLFENGEAWAATQEDWDNFYNITDTEEITVDDEQSEPSPEIIGEPQPLPIDSVLDELKTMKNKYLMSLADIENLRKRTSIEKANLMKYQDEHLAIDILDILDNFERALKTDNSEGVQLIYKQFNDVLSKHQIEKIKINEGDAFDSEYMNAMGTVPTGKFTKNSVVLVQRNGYKLKDKIIRYANVLVEA